MSWAHGMDNLKSSFSWNIFRNSFPNDPTPTISHMELGPCKNLILYSKRISSPHCGQLKKCPQPPPALSNIFSTYIL